MNIHHLVLSLAAAGLLAAPAAQAQPKPPVNVKIVGFNDYHGNLQSPGTFGQNTGVPSNLRPPVGGAEFLAGYVAQMKAGNPNTIVVGAGDFIGATPLISALFFDEPSVETLNRIGLDFVAVGNHEFDKGKDELKRLQNGGCKITNGATDPNSCRGADVGTPVPFEGAKYKWLSANVIETATGKSLLPAYGIKRVGNQRIGFIGMTLEGTPAIVTPTGVAGLEFRDEADTVNALIPRLRAQGVEAIVVLVHEGAFQGAGNSDINGCVGDLAGSALAGIVGRLHNEVDLVISGHTHAAYNCSKNTLDNGTVARPTGLPNRNGRLIPVTSASAFGRVLTEIDLQIDPATGDVIPGSVSPVNKLVDRNNAAVTPNAQVASIVNAYNLLQAPLANSVLGSITEALPNVGNAAGEQPAGLMIADAQLAATTPAGLGGAVAAFMNPGGVRNPGFTFPSSAAGEGDGNVTYGEAFTVQPFGNSLVTMTVTAKQLKDLLEQQFVGCLGQGTQRILQVSNGVSYSYSASAPACAKIIDLTLTPTDTTVVPPVVIGAPEAVVVGGALAVDANKPYRITVNNFLATGGDGFTTLLGGTSVQGGAQDIDALVAYMLNFKAPAAPYDPNLPALKKPRITRLP
ncbi:MAG: bifunctional metallophosphatase/5'-nucleotidase [Rubrivivax sp.]|nr:bifunctional metallophosphatase/5'-nucleotidase [Rubrivivax sp.]